MGSTGDTARAASGFPECEKCGQRAVMPRDPALALATPLEALVGVANQLVCAACGDSGMCFSAKVLDEARNAWRDFENDTGRNALHWWRDKLAAERDKVERLKQGRW